MLIYVLISAISAVIVLIYAWDIYRFKQAHQNCNLKKTPPKYPSLIPYFGNICAILWSFPKFSERATSYEGRFTSSKITLLPDWDLYLFQDHDTVREIWSKSAQLSSHAVYVYACKYLFGMPQKWVSKLAADNSGPYSKPHVMSNIMPEDRAHYILSKGVTTSLAGSEFQPTLERFRRGLISRFHDLEPTQGNLIEIQDFRKFVHETIGLSLIDAIFGPTLVRINPNFMDDLFELDLMLPWFAKGIPTFLIPRKYAIRQRMQQYFKNWYSFAQNLREDVSTESKADSSAWIKQRLQILDEISDEDTVASVDVGAAWASTTNIVSATTLALLHVAEDGNLLERVRKEVDLVLRNGTLAEIDLKELTKNPLLSSIYAETLRLHVKSFTVFSSPHSDITLGNHILPRGSIGILNSGLSHMDKTVWNTNDGSHPLDTFWADRFLIDPNDPSSGPRLPVNTRNGPDSKVKNYQEDVKTPYFSTDGLQEQWFPFGGGRLICPGRFIARSVMNLTTALILREYDIVRLTDSIRFSSRSYGFGTEQPKHDVPVYLKRRS